MRVSLGILLVLMTSVVARAEDLDLVDIYGSLRPELIVRTPEDGETLRWMDDGYSRVGVKGASELRDGLIGFYKYERRVSSNDGQDDGAVRSDNNELRQVHLGMRGKFGSVAIGRHYGLYYDFIDDELDRHRSHYADAIVYGDLFVSNAIRYDSNAMGPFVFGALVELNDADSSGDAIDERIEVSGTFAQGPVRVHAGYVDDPDHDGLFVLAASVSLNKVRLTGVFEDLSRDQNRGERLYSAAIDVALTPKNNLRGAVTFREDEVDGSQRDLLYPGSGSRLLGSLPGVHRVFQASYRCGAGVR